MHKIFRDKTGGEKILSVWWLLILILVGGAIAFGVSMFYSAEVDARNAEAWILNNKLSDCIFEQGVLIDNLFEKNFDIFQECKLNKEVIDDSFYFNISFLDGQNKMKYISKGISSFETECIAQEKETEAKHFSKCVKETRGIVYMKDDQIIKGRLEILTASNQVGERISSLK